MAVTFSFSFSFLLWKNFKLWKVATVRRTPINPVSICQHFTTLALSFFSGYVCVLVHTLLNYSKGAVYVYAPSPYNILVYSIKASMFSYINPSVMIKFRKFNISIVSLPYPQSTSKFSQLPSYGLGKAILFHPASNPGSRISLASFNLRHFQGIQARWFIKCWLVWCFFVIRIGYPWLNQPLNCLILFIFFF